MREAIITAFVVVLQSSHIVKTKKKKKHHSTGYLLVSVKMYSTVHLTHGVLFPLNLFPHEVWFVVFSVLHTATTQLYIALFFWGLLAFFNLYFESLFKYSM